jgi:hypothetical protein
MPKPTSPGIPSPPKPPKLSLPKPSPPKPRSLNPGRPPARPYQPKPAKLAAPRPRARLQPPKPPRPDFPKPHTSDSLTVIPQARAGASANPQKPVAPTAPAQAATPQTVPIKTVLWISGYAALLATTKLMLEAEGFEVHAASDFLQVQSACNEDRFQLAIVDHTLAPKIKRAIAAVIREKRPSTYILELCQVSSEIPDTDYILIGHEPDALVKMVLRIARERQP